MADEKTSHLRSRTSEPDDPTVLSAHDESTVLSSGDESTVLSAFSGGSRSGGASYASSGSSSGAWGVDARRLEAGQTFGPYTIVRLLGRGGMGEVYEAEQIATGRRVALKLLRGRMDEREDRARFLSEGRLAASISHPHTVYIFGSEEIEGLPAISMQLLPGGTLKDRVVDKGPMPTAEAVTAILDVIGGLDAAATAGILHRDIKPSNCFVDRDGSVKVGDFGLSISTSAREVSGKPRGFQGTPAYAPPEQLRGEPLDVRADIYAVGATLCYLLTGKAPFEGKEFQELVARVKDAPPPLVHKLRAGVPSALGKVVARCLAKNPEDRPASYADLAKLLRPFSGASRPAPPMLRFVAGAIDVFAVAIMASIVRSAFGAAATNIKVGVTVDTDPWVMVSGVIYFALLEGGFGWSFGKKICGLRVLSLAGPLSWWQAIGRAAVFYAPSVPLIAVAFIMGERGLAEFLRAHLWVVSVIVAVPLLLNGALFVTMRRRNGWAALQDLWTRTRVVQRRTFSLRRAESAVAPSGPSGVEVSERTRLGSFELERLLGEDDGRRWYEGVDIILKRRVWVVEVPPGTPEVPRARRDVDRIGRLHWLSGRRFAGSETAPAEHWDAFEAPEGAPVDPTPGASPWKAVFGWLTDLAAELHAAERDGTTPDLALDRVWIRPDGRAVLLDFSAATHTPGSPGERAASRSQFLASVGRLALGHAANPVPVSAIAMIDRWAAKPSLTMDVAEADLLAVSMSPERVARSRRLTPIALGALPIVLMLLAFVIATRDAKYAMAPESRVMFDLLDELKDERDPARRAALETYLAGTAGTRLDDDAVWKGVKATDGDAEVAQLRALARRAAAARPSADEVARATEVIRPTIERIQQNADDDGVVTIFIALVMVGCAMTFFSGLVSVLVKPSGLVLTVLGLAVVAADGREVSRFRAVVRLLLAWSPMLSYSAALALPATRPWANHIAPPAIALAIVAVGTLWTAFRPTRGPHDIVVGTRIGVR